MWDYTLRCLHSASTEISEFSAAQSCVSAYSLMILLFKLRDGHCTGNTHHVFILISFLTQGIKPTKTQGDSIVNVLTPSQTFTC